jgi:hypothetical protein
MQDTIPYGTLYFYKKQKKISCFFQRRILTVLDPKQNRMIPYVRPDQEQLRRYKILDAQHCLEALLQVGVDLWHQVSQFPAHQLVRI